MALPQHKRQISLNLPLIYDGLGLYELAAWHNYHRKRNDDETCLKIEMAVSKMAHVDRVTISKLNFYQPLK